MQLTSVEPQSPPPRPPPGPLPRTGRDAAARQPSSNCRRAFDNRPDNVPGFSPVPPPPRPGPLPCKSHSTRAVRSAPATGPLLRARPLEGAPKSRPRQASSLRRPQSFARAAAARERFVICDTRAPCSQAPTDGARMRAADWTNAETWPERRPRRRPRSEAGAGTPPKQRSVAADQAPNAAHRVARRNRAQLRIAEGPWPIGRLHSTRAGLLARASDSLHPSRNRLYPYVAVTACILRETVDVPLPQRDCPGLAASYDVGMMEENVNCGLLQFDVVFPLPEPMLHS